MPENRNNQPDKFERGQRLVRQRVHPREHEEHCEHELLSGLTAEQIREAFQFWRYRWFRYYDPANIDSRIMPFLRDGICTFPHGCLRPTREALLLSTAGMAERLQISRQTYIEIEKSEKEGAVTIETLKKVAAALDCELVYALRPKSGKRFSEVIWDEILRKAIRHPWVRSREPAFKARALAAAAEWASDDPKFRRERGWTCSKKKPPETGGLDIFGSIS